MSSSTVKTRGVVTSTIKYGESGVVARIFTRELGLQSFIIPSARGRRRRNIMPLLQPLSIVEMEALTNPKYSLQHIKEIHLAVPFRTIPFNETRRAISLFISELLSKTLAENCSDTELFDFILDAIISLDDGLKGEANFHIFFMFQLTKFLGYEPNIDEWNNDESLYLKVKNARLDSLENIATNREERKNLITILESYFSLHLPSFNSLDSTKIFAQMF